MEYGNLSHADRRTYNRAIVQTHRRRIELHVLTLNGGFVRSLTPRVTTGQITVDVEQTPMAVLTLSFVDPTHSLVFEPQSAAEAPLHRQYMVRVNDMRLIPGLGWVDCFVFTGPIWDFERQGALVSITAQSVERLAMGTVRKAKVWRRKTRKTTVMRGLLAEAGAVLMHIPDLPATTPLHTIAGVQHKPHSKKHERPRRPRGFDITREDTYLGKAQGLADSLNRLLFGDGSGVFVLRSHPERPVYYFREALLSDVDLQRPGSDGPNTWLVIGGKPKGSKHRVSSGLVGFPKAHPLSADSLAWHGKPAQILEKIQNPHFKTRVECRKVALRHRDRAARMLADVTIEALPIPWLRPWDLVAAQASWGVPTVTIRQMTYPLTPDNSPMTIGAVKRAVPSRVSSQGVS